MKPGDAVEFLLNGHWVSGKLSGVQKDGTNKVVVDVSPHAVRIAEGPRMKTGDAVEVTLDGEKWHPGRIKAMQKDGTAIVAVDDRDAIPHACEGVVIADEEHFREISVDSKSETVLNDAPNASTFHR